MKSPLGPWKRVAGLVLVAGFVALVAWIALSPRAVLERSVQQLSSDPLVRFAEAIRPAEPDSAWIVRGSVYVPAYASVRLGSGGDLVELAATLSIRNTSESRLLNVLDIEYYDSAGELVERYLSEPIALKQLGAMEIFVEATDMRAGPGAHFLVNWAASDRISEPVIESVMIGVKGTHGYSFVSEGRRLNEREQHAPAD
jgi:hypothetical protein